MYFNLEKSLLEEKEGIFTAQEIYSQPSIWKQSINSILNSKECISDFMSNFLKKDNKKITNYSGLLWILIWIPVLLIFASIAALVFVNRKAFLKQEASFADSDNVYSPKRRKLSAAEKAKLKNNHKNRTNSYRPRD